MSMLNSFSNSMTSSTMSRLSAPRSSMKLASSVILSRSTPSSFSMMSRTFWALSAMSGAPVVVLNAGKLAKVRAKCHVAKGTSGTTARSHHHAAVDDQRLARDVRSVVGGEEGDHAGDVARRPEPLARDLAGQGSAGLDRHRRRHVRLDETG